MRQSRLLIVLTFAVAAATLLHISLTVLYGQSLAGNAAFLGNAFSTAVINVSLLPENDAEPVTFLLYGIDAGEWVEGTYRPGTGRADVIFLIKAYPDHRAAVLLSI
ncbi:MAG TPA: hypothetical protein VLH18_02640, partial [Candidatus Limnocylindrales bacterium]|nr:hypothetical protein [Candidatus Limnocylindrales bacterium]